MAFHAQAKNPVGASSVRIGLSLDACRITGREMVNALPTIERQGRLVKGGTKQM
jgi:hypothetical protein